ncbi:MAG: hypothetical protein C4293_07330 [Nitrospiraceae bacterium]
MCFQVDRRQAPSESPPGLFCFSPYSFSRAALLQGLHAKHGLHLNHQLGLDRQRALPGRFKLRLSSFMRSIPITIDYPIYLRHGQAV